MDSFGIYAKPKPKPKNPNTEYSAILQPKPQNPNAEYSAILHVNIWNFSEEIGQKFRAKEPQCCVDFGLLIHNYEQLDELFFIFPFKIDAEKDFENLSGLISENKNKDIAIAIFNRHVFTGHEGGPENPDGFHTIQVEGVTKNAVLPDLSKDNIHSEDEFSYLRIDLKHMLCSPIVHDLYFRFRIKGQALSSQLLSPVTESNKFLESGFKKTKIIDFKINELRNINSVILNKAKAESLVPIFFHKVYYFIMESSTSEVVSPGLNPNECRKLEPLWEKYINAPVSNILAYQWKKGSSGNRGEQKFSHLTKITYSGTNWRIILLYLIAALLLGILSNFLYDCLSTLYQWIISGIRQLWI